MKDVAFIKVSQQNVGSLLLVKKVALIKENPFYLIGKNIRTLLDI